MLVRYLRDHNVKVTEHITRNLLLATIVMGTSVFSYGFETSVINTTQAMGAFERKFGEFLPAQDRYGFTSSKLAYLNSFPLITYAIGVIVGSLIGERFGRKKLFVGMNFICIAGTVVCLTSKSYGQMLAGRMILYIHVGMEAWLIPMFQAEIVPAAVRGSLVATYTFSHIFAGFVSSIVTNFTSRLAGDQSWMIPFGLILIWPTLVLTFCWIVPESPRWLVRRGQYDKAVQSILFLSGTRPDYPAEEEATLLLEAVQETKIQGKWSDMLRGTNKHRTLHGIIASALTQITGMSFASVYGTIFLKQINVMDAFTGTMIKRALLVLGCLIVMFFVDKTGRRPMFFVGGFITAACLMTMGGLGTIEPSSIPVKKGIVAMSILFPMTYINSFASCLQVVKSEIPHITLRDKSNMVFWSVANLSNFAATFSLPYLLNEPSNLGSRVGFIYGSIATAGLIWGYLWMPEMTNKSLEEIDEMFESKVPAWKTRHWKGTASARITEIENTGVAGAANSEKLAGIEEIESTTRAAGK